MVPKHSPIKFIKHLKKDIKYLICLCFSMVSFSLAKAQSEVSKKSQVENGIAPQSIILGDATLGLRSISNKLKENNINGISVAVIHEGKIDWVKSYGVRKAVLRDEVTTETLFQCASIGKIITSLAALKLVESGKISLDEPVNSKLKRWKFKDNALTQQQAVTLRHLLSHSSGLADEYGFPGYDPKKELPTVLQILNNEKPSITNKSLEIKSLPGSEERYSGAGYLVIQLLIEDLSGVSFPEYVQDQILDPFEMIHTTYSDRPDIDSNSLVAAGHRSNGKALKNKNYHIYPEKAAAGPWTTAEDLAKLILGLQSNSSPLISEMMTPQINNKGLGVNLKGLDRPEAFWHAGQNEGYTGLLYGLLNTGDGAVVLTNSIGGEQFIQEFIASVARVYDWPVMNSYHSLKIPDDLISNITGRYQTKDQTKSIQVDFEKGKLILKPNGSKRGAELLCIGDNHYSFRQAQDYYKINFVFEDETVTGMTYTESISKTIKLDKNP